MTLSTFSLKKYLGVLKANSLSIIKKLDANYQFSDSRTLLISFSSVTALLIIVGVIAASVVSHQNTSVDRFMSAGDLLELMDEARLSELTYTRDEDQEAVERTREILKEVLNKATWLETQISDEERKKRLNKAIKAISNYQDLFERYVKLSVENEEARDAMVGAAVTASTSANALQDIQEKYIRLDTESVRKLREQEEEIAENSANSYEIVISVEEALDHEKNFLLTGRLRDLERVKSVISNLNAIINRLKARVRDPLSQELIEKINHQKEAYAQTLLMLEQEFDPTNPPTLNTPRVLELDRAAFSMRDAAYALRSNERSVLSLVQKDLADMQELMARRLALSEEVSGILFGVGEARQADRDFLLSRTDEAREMLANSVLVQLEGVISTANKIQTLLIEDDEKATFGNVVPNIVEYRDKFSHTVDVVLQRSRTEKNMVTAALRADTLLSAAQADRLNDIEDARQWEGVLGPIGVLFALGIIFLAFLVRRTQQQVSEAYALISSSIDYAQHIQRSILPPSDKFNHEFPEHFIIWEPRDRVGGDFYALFDWGEGSLLIVADCTGHGVPGAFMSLIAMSSIETALDEVKPGDVGALIERTHQRVKDMTSRNRRDEDADDGLELGAIYFNKSKDQAIFSGARFSLFMKSAETGELVEIKGTRQGIGYNSTPDDYKFSNNLLEINNAVSMYMTSDGLIDQVGGERRRSFGKKRFMKLIQDCADLEMSSQRNIFKQTLLDFQGDERRRDDLTVIGITVK